MVTEAFTIWFTGLSGSGKSSVGRGVVEALRARGLTVELLDSGRIRQQLNRSLGFTREEIETNLVRLGYECRMLNRNGVIVVVAAVSPYRDVRDRLRSEISRFVEVYCDCPMEVLQTRGENNLYARAERGEIKHVAGVDAPYEAPTAPEVHLPSDQQSVAQGVDSVIARLEALGRIDAVEGSCYSPKEEEMIRKRLRDMGYL